MVNVNLALVVTNTHDLAEHVPCLKPSCSSTAPTSPPRSNAWNWVTVPASVPQRRVRIPDWFDEVRDEAEENLFVAQQRLDERNTERI